jgi:hypothetical protein
LPLSTAERRRKPSLVVFLAYKAPCFVEFEPRVAFADWRERLGQRL